jgi:hypothetical protein
MPECYASWSFSKPPVIRPRRWRRRFRLPNRLWRRVLAYALAKYMLAARTMSSLVTVIGFFS